MYDSSDEAEEEPPAPARTVPSDERLERALRDTVANVFRSGNLEDLTVRRVRHATEKALGLEEGFFKGDPRWKAKSDQIIKDEAVGGCSFFLLLPLQDMYTYTYVGYIDLC